jgi:hypothetical protein
MLQKTLFGNQRFRLLDTLSLPFMGRGDREAVGWGSLVRSAKHLVSVDA